MECVPRGRYLLSHHHLRQSSPAPRRDEVARFPTCTEETSPSAKRSQERGRHPQRPKRCRSACATSNRIDSRPKGQHLNFADIQSPDISQSGIQWYPDCHFSDDPSNRTLRATQTPSQFLVKSYLFLEETKATATAQISQVMLLTQRPHLRANRVGVPPRMPQLSWPSIW